MQKKILFSLLMTAPLGFSAYANINMPELSNADNWIPDGLAGDAFKIEGTSLSAQIGNGKITQKVTGLPQGTYSVGLTTPVNIQVAVYDKNGKKISNATGAFTVTESSNDVTVELTAINTSLPISFDKCQLVLRYNFAAEATRLTTLLAEQVPGGLNSLKVPHGTSESLSEQADAIRNAYEEIQSKIKKISNGDNAVGNEFVKILGLYKDEKLYNDNSTSMKSDLAEDIRNLKVSVDNYNENVDTYNKGEQNKADQAALIQNADELLKELEALEGEIKTSCDQEGYKDLSDCLSSATSLRSEIKKYIEDINAAYAKPEEDIKFSSRYDEFSGKITDLKDAYNSDKADNKAYNDYVLLKSNLLNAYVKDQGIINSFSGIKGYENVYEEAKETWQAELTKLFNEENAKEYGFGGLVQKGDAERIEAAKNGINEGIAKMAELVDGFKGVVDDQNQQMTIMLDEIKKLNGNLADVTKNLTVPEHFKADYNAKVEEIKDAIAALREETANDYSNQKLSAEDKAATVEEIQKKIDELKDYVAKFAVINDLLDALDKAMADSALSGNLAGTNVPVKSKFGTDLEHDGTFKNIYNSIINIKINPETNEPVEADAKNIKDQIAKIATDAKELKEIYQNIEDALSAANIGYKDLEKYAAGEVKGNKIIVPAAQTLRDEVEKMMADMVDYQSLKEFSEKFTASRNAAAALDGQECWDNGKALWEEIREAGKTKEDIDKKSDEIKLQFTSEVTKDKNYVNTSDLLEKARTLAKITGTGGLSQDADYQGAADMVTKYKALQKRLSDIKTNLNNASDVADYEAVDVKLKTLYADIETYQAKVQNLLDNQKAYNELYAQIDPDLYDKIKDVYERNQDNSVENGLKFFEGIIGNRDDAGSTATNATLYSQATQLLNELEKAYKEDWNTESKNANGKKTEFQDRINALEGTIDYTSKWIDLNNDAHLSQLNKWNEVFNKYQQAHDQLVEMNAEGLVKDELAELETLNNNEKETKNQADLIEVMSAIYNSYGDGKSNDNNAAITGDLQWISDKIDSIMAKVNNDYPGRVDEYNKQIVAKCGWDAKVAEMWNTFRACTSLYNAYYYDLSNKDYREAMQTVMAERHSDYFAFDGVIKAMNPDLTAWLAEMKENRQTIDENDFNTEWTSKANLCIEEMVNKFISMETDANTVAENYWNDHSGEAFKVIATAEQTLIAAGIEQDIIEKYMGPAKTVQSGAEELKEKADKAEATWEADGDTEKKYENTYEQIENGSYVEYFKALPGIVMDDIADQLSTIPGLIDLQAAAEESWRSVFPTDKALEELRNKIVNDCPNVTQELKDAQLEIFDATAEEIKALGEDVDGIKEGLIDVYAKKKAELDKLMDELNGAVKVVTDAQDKAVAEKEALDKAQKDIADLNEALNGLDDYARGFSQAYKTDAERQAIRNRIDALEAYVNSPAASGKLTTPEVAGYIADEIKGIQDNILYIKGHIATTEYNYVLKELDPATRVAHNNARNWSIANDDKNKEELDEMWDQINALNEEVVAGNPVLTNPDFDFDAFKKEVLGWEAQYCSFIQELDEKYHGEQDDLNPAQNALDRLNSGYDSLTADIAAGREALNGCMDEVKSEYSKAFDELQEALEALKKDWSDDGNNLISFEASYNNELEKLAGSLSDLNDEVKVAEEKAQAEKAAKEANEAAYQDLLAQWKALDEELESVKSMIDDEYGYGDIYDGTLEYIRLTLDNSKEALDNSYANVELTADSELQNHDKIALWIKNAKTNSTRRYADSKIQGAQTALYQASQSLTAHIVPEEFNKLQAKYNELCGDLATIVNTGGQTYEWLVEAIAEAERIASEAAELAANAKENSYVPGDVDLDPDGLVNTVDVQQLISWVGNDVTYQDLYEQNPRQACAADLTNDEEINIADVTLDIKLALGYSIEDVLATRYLKAMKASCTYALQLVGEEDGVKRYALFINNPMALTGGQLDIMAAAGSEITGVEFAGRNTDHQLYLFDRGFGGKRAVIASMLNSEFSGNDGQLLFIDVKGEAVPEIENALFTDTHCGTYELSTNSSSLVDTLIDAAKEFKETIYNVGGQTLNKLQKGINIIRKGNGKATKSMQK